MAGAGMFLVLFLAWLVWGGTSQPDAHQRAVNQAVVRAWTRRPALPAANTAQDAAAQTVLLRIPALGAGWEYPVYEGISEDNLDKGIAHYSQTAGPGMAGNYAIAGHRSSDIGFHPWADLPDLVGRGSTVVVLTRDTVYTYVIDASEQTTPFDLTPLQPDQGRGADPATRLITLTTCTPRFGSTGRFILFGHLVGRRPFATGDH
jgi:sortase A